MSIVGLPSKQETRLPCPADEHDARVWTEILMNKPRLSTFTGRVLLRGFALKRGPSTRDILNWKRHFFVLQFPFLLYFLQNDPTAECVGVVYLRGAMVEHIVHHSSQQNVMRIIPVVRRNLKRTAKDPDEDNFYISFGTERELEKWLGVLNEQLLGKPALKEESSISFAPPLTKHQERLEEDRSEERPAGSRERSPPSPTSATPSSSNVTPSNSSSFLALNPPGAAVPSSAAGKSAPLAPASSVSRSPASTGLAPGLNRGAVSPSNPSITVTSSTGAVVVASKEKDGGGTLVGRSAVIRRKSFFTTLDPMATKNTDHIHHTHCSICKVSPVIGYLYTCANCDNYQLCAHCYREDDHDIRHHFYLAPEIASDTLRVAPSLEGGSKAFRTVELVVFEALFRTIGDVLDGAATKPLPKRKLLHFWDSAITATGGYVDLDVDSSTLAAIQPTASGGREETTRGTGFDNHDSSPWDRDGYPYNSPPDSAKPVFRIDPITEKSLSWFCRAPGVIAFDEFMCFLRWRIMNGSTHYSAVLICFSVLTEMIHAVNSEMGYESQPLAARQKKMRKKDGPTVGLDNLEMATLQVYLGTCAVEGKRVRSADLEAITERLQLLLHYLRRSGTATAANLSAIASSTSNAIEGSDADGSRMIPVEDAIERVILLATSGSHLLCKCPDSFHRVVEVVESAMLYHLGEGFGLYSAQPEAFHACCCDSCGVFPIIGVRYYCSQCCVEEQDFDLCAHCFCFSPPQHQHTQFIKTPGQLPTTLGMSGAGNQSIAAGGSTFSSLAPQSGPSPNKRVQFMLDV